MKKKKKVTKGGKDKKNNKKTVLKNKTYNLKKKKKKNQWTKSMIFISITSSYFLSFFVCFLHFQIINIALCVILVNPLSVINL